MNKKKLLYFDEIHIPNVFLDIIKNAWLVLLAAIIAWISVFAYANLGHKPSYTTEVNFVVSPRSNGSYVGFYSSMSTANEMTSVFGEVFSSDVLKRMIREDLQQPNLSFSVTASVPEGTNILLVTAKASSPEDAHMVMQSVLKNYRRVSGYLFGGVVLDVLKKPQISVAPSNPFNTKQYFVLGTVLAVLMMVCLIAVVSVFRPTTKTIACAKRRMEDSSLEILQKERKFRPRRQSKKPLLITDASTSFRYTESCLQLAQKIRHKMQKSNMKILLVTSVAENEGKTTVSANLALALVKQGHKVAYVDMDLRKPAVHKIFSSLPQEDLYTCLEEGLPASRDASEQLYILSNSNPRSGTDRLLHSEALTNLLENLRNKVDFVILDSAPYTATADTGMLLQHVDCCVMVMRQDWAPFAVCRDVAEDLGDGKAEYLGYIFNHYVDNGSLQTFTDRYGKYGYYGKEKAE